MLNGGLLLTWAISHRGMFVYAGCIFVAVYLAYTALRKSVFSGMNCLELPPGSV
jgi:hypothetical protein